MVDVRRPARRPEVQEHDHDGSGVGAFAKRPLLRRAPLSEAPVTAAELAGVWAGTLSHGGETEPIALELEAGTDGKVLIRMSVPVAHLVRAPDRSVPAQFQGNEVRLGPFVLEYDRAAKTLSGVAPRDLVPLYEMPLAAARRAVRRGAARGEGAPLATPVWTFDAGSPLWAGATFAEGTVYAGGQDGQLHAVDARSGQKRWSFRAGGPIRTRPTVAGAELYFQADDGYLYKLASGSGEERWRVRVVEKPIERLPFDNPKSRYDRFGSDVRGRRTAVSRHPRRAGACDGPVAGREDLEFTSGDSVLAAPAVEGDRVFFGSFDGSVYALEAGTGKRVWKRDTRGAVVSTPALVRRPRGRRQSELRPGGPRRADGRASLDTVHLVLVGRVVGRRARRCRLRRLVGCRRRLRLRARTGERRWKADVYGWAWGQPAVTDRGSTRGRPARRTTWPATRAWSWRSTGRPDARVALRGGAGRDRGVRLPGLTGRGGRPRLRHRPRRQGVRLEQ